MLTTRTARWSALTGLVCVVVLVATWFVLVSPRRSQAADLDDQRTSAEARNTTLEAEIAALQRQYAELPELREQLATIRRQMPPASDVAKLVRSLSDLAGDSGVELDSIVPGTATVLTPAAGTTPALVSVPVTVTVSGRYVESALFLRYLQTRLGRVLLVTQVNAARNEEAASTSTSAGSAPTATATSTPTATATATASATATLPDDFTLTISGEIFSLVDAPAPSVAAAPGATVPPAAPAAGGSAPAATTQ